MIRLYTPIRKPLILTDFSRTKVEFSLRILAKLLSDLVDGKYSALYLVYESFSDRHFASPITDGVQENSLRRIPSI